MDGTKGEQAGRERASAVHNVTEESKNAAALSFSQSCKFVSSHELKEPGRGNPLPRGKSMFDSTSGRSNLNVAASSKNSIGAHGLNGATGAHGSNMDRNGAAAKAYGPDQGGSHGKA